MISIMLTTNIILKLSHRRRTLIVIYKYTEYSNNCARQDREASSPPTDFRHVLEHMMPNADARTLKCSHSLYRMTFDLSVYYRDDVY